MKSSHTVCSHACTAQPAGRKGNSGCERSSARIWFFSSRKARGSEISTREHDAIVFSECGTPVSLSPTQHSAN
jgi:hypothetical protein